MMGCTTIVKIYLKENDNMKNIRCWYSASLNNSIRINDWNVTYENEKKCDTQFLGIENIMKFWSR